MVLGTILSKELKYTTCVQKILCYFPNCTTYYWANSSTEIF